MPRVSDGMLMYRIHDGELQMLLAHPGGPFFEGDCDSSAIVSNTFTTEWPPKSGRQMEFPEMFRADFIDVAAAKRKIKAGQEALI